MLFNISLSSSIESCGSSSSRGRNGRVRSIKIVCGRTQSRVRIAHPETGQHILRLWSKCSQVHARGEVEVGGWKERVTHATRCPATRPQTVARKDAHVGMILSRGQSPIRFTIPLRIPFVSRLSPRDWTTFLPVGSHRPPVSFARSFARSVPP